MKKVSTARAKQMREYKKLKCLFLDGQHFCWGCAKWLPRDKRELHHRFGRVGRLLCWVTGFTCACDECHRQVKEDPKHAHDILKCPPGCWNDFRRAVAWHNQKDTK